MRFSRLLLCAMLCVGSFCLAGEWPMLFAPQDVYRYNDLPDRIGKLYLPVGHPGTIHVKPHSAGKGVRQVRLRVQVPEAVRIRLFGNRAFWRSTVTCKPVSESVNQGIRTYEFALGAEKIGSRPVDYMVYFQGDFRGLKGTSAELVFWGDGQPKSIHRFEIVPVELPAIRRPKSYRLFAYNALSVELPDAEMSEKNAAYYEQLGINSLLIPRNRGYEPCLPAYRMLERRGWWLGMSCGWSPGFKIVPTEDNLCRDSKGRPNPENKAPHWWVRYCPEYLIEECLKRQNTMDLRTSGISCNGLYLDCELYTQKLPLLEICRCPRCLEAFSRYSGISQSKFTRENVSTKYHAQWLEFRKKQQADLVGAFVGMYRNKKMEFCFNSLFEYPDSDNSFSLIRNAYYEPFSDYIMPMTYVRGAKIFDVINHNVASTRAKFIPMVYSFALDWLPDWNTPAEFALDMVSSAACGSAGLAFFCNADFDGLYGLEIMRALNAIAVCEEFNADRFNRCDRDVRILNDFPKQQLEVDGKPVEVAAVPIDGVRHVARRKEGTLLVQLFNYSARSAEIRVAVPEIKEGSYVLENPVTGARHILSPQVQTLSSGQLQAGIPLTLKPFSYLALTLKAVSGTVAACPVTVLVPQRGTARQAQVQEPRLERDGIVICRTERKDSKRHDVLMESDEISLWIDLSDNGKITRLVNRKQNREYCREPGIGLMRESFDIPQASSIGVPYAVIGRRIAKSRGEVTLEARPKHGVLKDFIIRKTYVLHGDRPQIDVSYAIEVRRNVKAKADFRMRVKNCPSFGLKGENLVGAISFVCRSGGREMVEQGTSHVGFGYKEGMFKGYLSRTLKGVFDSQEFSLRTKVGSLTFSCPKETQVSQFFSWRSGVPTAEIFLRKTDFPYDPHQTKLWRASISCLMK